EPHLRRLRPDAPQPGTLCLRIRLRGAVAHRAATQGRGGAELRCEEGAGAGAVAELGAVPVGQRQHPPDGRLPLRGARPGPGRDPPVAVRSGKSGPPDAAVFPERCDDAALVRAAVGNLHAGQSSSFPNSCSLLVPKLLFGNALLRNSVSPPPPDAARQYETEF